MNHDTGGLMGSIIVLNEAVFSKKMHMRLQVTKKKIRFGGKTIRVVEGVPT
jgi:hypothetical protein